MKKQIYLFSLALLSYVQTGFGQQNPLTIGSTFPLAKLAPIQYPTRPIEDADLDSRVLDAPGQRTHERIPFDSFPTKLVVFVPELSLSCTYAYTLLKAFKLYFYGGLSFIEPKRDQYTQVMIVPYTPEKQPTAFPGYTFFPYVYKNQAALYETFGVQVPASADADATVVLLDGQNRIQWVDRGYRGQGEHLKPLDKKIKELLGQPDPLASIPAIKALQIGDQAPDFLVNATRKLSDYKGKTVLLSFYPAAFSGKIPQKLQPQNLGSPLENKDKMLFRTMSCVLQLTTFDHAMQAFSTDDSGESPVVNLSVSSSTIPLLALWKQALKTENTVYVNDLDYAISQRYSSYNAAKGYNNRAVYIIDAAGKIAYIDMDYTVEDEVVVKQKLKEISGI